MPHDIIAVAVAWATCVFVTAWACRVSLTDLANRAAHGEATMSEALTMIAAFLVVFTIVKYSLDWLL